ncbi:MAG: hypothetical protein GC158_11580 [Cyanobacteria bacterium RI_101]|nr:hypothetical protein [Cyanobacteria bacterium RI_101]
MNLRQKHPWITRLCLLLTALAGSLLLGWGLAQGFAPAPALAQTPTLPVLAAPRPKVEEMGPVDAIPSRYKPGFEAYWDTCSTCHIALPPEVLPTESWQTILQRPDEHFGVAVPNINRFTQLLIWDYVSAFSRPLPPNSVVPLYAEKSRYFKVLHPGVELPADTTAKTCVVCHPQVKSFNFRALTPEWEKGS